MFQIRKLFAAFIAALILQGIAVSQAAAADPLEGLPAGAPIPDQYIVEIGRPEGLVTNVAGLAQQLLAGVGGGKVLHVYERALRGFAAQMTASQAALLAQTQGVLSVEPDRVVRINTTQSNATWGLDRIDQRHRPMDHRYVYPGAAGQGVHIYVIDTGLKATHTEFTGRVGNGYDSVDAGAPDDCNGHGTHVAGTAAGTVYGVAKKATIHPVRVLDCQGSGSTSGVIAGVNWVVTHHIKPAVANMSLGGGASVPLDHAVQTAIAAGVTFAVAGGNDNANACNESPARVPEAITVGATVNDDSRASYSNFGTCLDLFAPGSSITSAWYTSSTATHTISGTSMASPHVAGAAALVLGRDPELTPLQVRDILVGESTPDVISNPGTGSPNRLLYVDPGLADSVPVASFTSVCTELDCNFDGTASTDDGGITDYAWDFGDGSAGSGATLGHSYAAAGTYTVILTVTDTVDQTDTRTRFITVPTQEVKNSVDLAISQTVSADSAIESDDLSFSLVVSNNGPDDAREVQVFDSLPQGLSLISAAPSQGSCRAMSVDVLSCDLEDLALGASASVSLVARTTSPGAITHTASVISGALDEDLDTSDNESSVSVTVEALDIAPDAFSFTDVSNVARGSVQTSNPITVTGINKAAPVKISGGMFGINGGTCTLTSGTVVSGNQVRVCHTASTGFSNAVNTTLTIGASGSLTGVSDTFTSITRAVAHGSLQLGATSYTVGEAAGTVAITLTRTGGSDGAVGVRFATSNGSAVAGSDYTGVGTTVSWADRDSASKTVRVTILNDTRIDGPESFKVTLSGATGAGPGSPAQASVNITDNEILPTCNGTTPTRTCTVNGASSQLCVGTSGTDTIVGSSGNDVIVGLAGNDSINGSAGNDLICGGDGNDKLTGGTGLDKLYGDAGTDVCTDTDTNTVRTSCESQ